MNDQSELERPVRADSSGRLQLAPVVTLLLLTLAGTCSMMDRAIVNVALEPIRRDFGLSDAELGLIAGLAASACYGLASIPFGMLADYVNRRNLIALSLAIWSVMTGLCSFANGFGPLVLARMGVGLGEAGSGPATMSVISALFPPKSRASAVSVFYLCNPLGALLALAVGGFLIQSIGWRPTFLIAAVPGLAVSVTLMLVVREPARLEHPLASQRQLLKSAVAFLVTHRALPHLLIAITLVTFASMAISAWAPSFFIRYHGMTIGSVGRVLGLSNGILGFAGVLVSGPAADFLGRRDPRLRLWGLATASLLLTPIVIVALLIEPGAGAMTLYIVHVFFVFLFTAPSTAITLSLAPAHLRGTVASIQFVGTFVLGMGLGPSLAGLLSTVLGGAFGSASLRWALVFDALVFSWAGLHYWLSARNLGPSSGSQEGM